MFTDQRFEVYVDDPDSPAFRNVTTYEINEGVMTLFVEGGSQVILPLIHHQAIEMRPQ